MSDDILDKPCSVFDGVRRVASGPLREVAAAFKAALEKGGRGPVFLFDDTTGRTFDIDVRGTNAEILARLTRGRRAAPVVDDDAPRGPGRPKLGVVAREVTLLPRHWEWLAAQPGGASVGLRKLVDTARKADEGKTRARAARDAAYHFISAMAGDRSGFEEASRALFAGDRAKFAAQIAGWPKDVREHAANLAFGTVRKT